HSGVDVPLPIGIAEVGLPDARVGEPPAEFDSGCRDDLLRIDDEPVPLRIRGETAEVLEREELSVEPCGPASIELAAGRHDVRSTPGRVTGMDTDTVALASEAGGGPLDPGAWADAPTASAGAPEVEVTDDGPVSVTAEVSGL